MLEPLLSVLNNMRVILATSSKQRQDLLRPTGLKFEVCTSDFAEDLDKSKYTFSEYVVETAYGKVQSVYDKLKNEEPTPDIIIGLDTMIHFDGQLIGKPKDDEDAFGILTKLANGVDPHFVVTGVVIRYKDRLEKFSQETTVYMKKLSKEEILSYIATKEHRGKAGAYAIQGIASTFVEKINGDYNNVIGIPICKLSEKLKQLVMES